MATGDIDDIDAMLEESYQKKEDKRDSENGEKSRSRSPGRGSSKRSRSKSRDRGGRSKRSRSKDRKRSKSKDRSRRDRSRSKEKKERKRSKSRERKRSRSKERRRSKSPRGFGRRGGRRSPPRFGGGGGGRFGRGIGGIGGGAGGGARSRSRSPAEPALTPEERDSRTVFVMQLSQRVRARDIDEFFSSVGKIRDVKLIICNKTRRFKGIAYVEFKDIESVTLAMGLAGQKLLGVPVVVQPSQAEKNRAASYGQEMSMPNANGRPNDKGPMRLYVGSLHFNITEEMLQGIFEPFGKIQSIQLIQDQETQRSKGYGFITYAEAEDAKKALEQMNGFELAGRAMKVGHVTERGGFTEGLPGQPSGFKLGAGLDSEAVDKTGIDLGATGRLALMAKLAQGTGMQLPQQASQALDQAQANMYQHPSQPQNAAQHHQQAAQLLAEQQQQQQQQQQPQQPQQQGPPIATQCFMLSNMFDPAEESAVNWDQEVRDDVIEEGSKHGGFLHIVVDKASTQGNVYVKCPNVATAVAAVNALHGRWFAGKVITAAYVPLVNYHNLFPDSAYAQQILTARK